LESVYQVMGPAKFRTIAFSGRPEDFPQWRMQFTTRTKKI